MTVKNIRILFFVFLGFLSAMAGASSPEISYQGQLNDNTGAEVSGLVTFEFRIYEVEAGGDSLWEESQVVSVSNGVFNVVLGSVNPLPELMFEKDDLYLGIKAGIDSEMAPRQKFLHTARSVRADLSALTARTFPSFFGDNSNGEFVSAGLEEFSRGTVYEFNSFSLLEGHILRAIGGSRADPIIIKVNGDCVIEGVIDLAGAGMEGGVGGENGEDLPNALRGGRNGETAGVTTGGSGGGGGAGAAEQGVKSGGSAAGTWMYLAASDPTSVLVGAGGGGGGNFPAHGRGGNGGGAMLLMVGGDLAITGDILVAGANGSVGGGGSFGQGGGGGGGGGSIVIYYAGEFDDSFATYHVEGGLGGEGQVPSSGSPGLRGGAGGSGKVVAIKTKEIPVSP